MYYLIAFASILIGFSIGCMFMQRLLTPTKKELANKRIEFNKRLASAWERGYVSTHDNCRQEAHRQWNLGYKMAYASHMYDRRMAGRQREVDTLTDMPVISE